MGLQVYFCVMIQFLYDNIKYIHIYYLNTFVFLKYLGYFYTVHTTDVLGVMASMTSVVFLVSDEKLIVEIGKHAISLVTGGIDTVHK